MLTYQFPVLSKNRLNKYCKLIYNYLQNFLCYFTFIYNFICEIYGIKQNFKGILLGGRGLGLTSSFGCLETHHVGQTGLNSVFLLSLPLWVLGLMACATIPRNFHLFMIHEMQFMKLLMKFKLPDVCLFCSYFCLYH